MTKYARVMHHIGGLSGQNDNSDMIRGGEDEFTLITDKDLPEGIEKEQVARLFELGALREATPDEVERWEVSKGLRKPAAADADVTAFTTGNETLQGGQGAAPVGGGADEAELGSGAAIGSAGHSGTYKGLTKGELSEFTVPELKGMAKEEGIEGYAEMNKDPLLEALLALGN